MPSSTSHSRAALLAWGALGIFAIVYGVICVRHGWWDPPKDDGSDFTAYYSAGELALKGEDIFNFRASSTPRRPFIYPATFAVFPMALFALFPHNLAAALFYIANVAMLLGSLWMLRRLLWPDSTAEHPSFWKRPAIGLFLAVIVCWRFVDSNMKLGNANMYTFFLLTLALYWMQRSKGFLGGLAVALATSFKVTPGIFGLSFLWRWQPRAMLGGAAGLVFFLFVLPIPFLGVRGNIETLRAFGAHVLDKLGQDDDDDDDGKRAVGWGSAADDVHPFGEPKQPRAVGISLKGTMLKLFAPTTSLDHRKPKQKSDDPLELQIEKYLSGKMKPDERAAMTATAESDASFKERLLTRIAADEKDRRVNIASFEPASVQRAASIAALVMLILTAMITAPRWTKEGALPPVLAWGLVAVAMCLISPLTRKAHLTVLILPVSTLIAALQQGVLCRVSKPLAWAALVLLGAGGLVTSVEIIGDRGSQVVHAMGIATASMLLLYAAVAAALFSLKGRTAGVGGQGSGVGNGASLNSGTRDRNLNQIPFL